MGYGRSRWTVAGRVALGTLAVLDILAGGVVVGCALNPQPEPPATAGSGAAAGNGGTSGTSGSGGQAGAGGASAGVGGTLGGTGGSGGGTSSGGGSGTGGSGAPDAGTGDGATDGPEIPPDFSDCVQPPPSTCSPLDTCHALGNCGAPTSFLDENGCLRATCSADADCATGERCLPTSLVGGCEPSVLESCAPDASEGCICNATTDCAARAQCVLESQAPRDADCLLAGRTCEELTIQASLVAMQLHSGLARELVDALDACRRALLEQRRTTCR